MPERVAALMEDRRRLERQVTELQKKLATGGGAAEVEEVAGVKLAARNLGEVPARDLKGIAEAIGKQIGSGVVALVSTADGKASIVVGVSPELTGRFSAVDLVRAASAAVGGKGGGGRPDMAQAGGPDGAGGCGARGRAGGARELRIPADIQANDPTASVRPVCGDTWRSPGRKHLLCGPLPSPFLNFVRNPVGPTAQSYPERPRPSKNQIFSR